MTRMWGVYRVHKSGRLDYVPRSCTGNEKLAKELAEERSRGEITTPTGKVVNVPAVPHVHKEIG